MAKIPVKGHTGLVRDTRTGAIININKSEIDAARERKQLRRQKQETIDQTIEDVKEMKQDINEMKQLLKQLIERN